ncbi:phenylalanine--tRNA ligase subunit beta [Phytohalomonas tamaricis]|uniref:phenylalanine--tRNA ligase subunit beta n=1 Tax=Phytohalomonas tamaricis TaxID=2081032 RepID=UPI000D0B8D72|nr:phenylalanine--tRNA ligase subunit beta [Phytohalomonas tamaricis]
MKVSEQWLRQWVSLDMDAQGIADQITMAGLEVDAVEAVAETFSGVVVAHVKSVSRHPDADKLNVCQVDDGSGESVQVVCGAPNVAEGQKIAFARVGAVLPGDFKIKKAKLRGVESRGMVCSSSELGLEEERSEGILVLADDAPVGEDFRHWLSLDDHTIDVDLTPNRGDCLSVQGLARELGVLNRLPVEALHIDDVAELNTDTFPVSINAPEACPRYVARVVRDVDVTAATPMWMSERLRRSGIRSIDVVVDITNYVMLELGQPMHAFDLETLQGSIEVRMAREGEQLTLLNDQSIALRDDTLVIADDRGPLAIAGVMGGEHSGVNASTRHILFESAFFAPLAIAGKARSYGLHTDSSHRFERGVDSELQRKAIERATQLLLPIAGGAPGPLVEVASPDHLPSQRHVTLRAGQVARVLGVALKGEEITDILTRLGMEIAAQGNDVWDIIVPSWRFDISLEADLIEELARVYGYNRLPVRYPSARLAPRAIQESQHPLAHLRRQLVARGYQEAITYSFVSPELQMALTPQAVSPTLANPISSDMSVMRSSLWPGLVKTLMHNLNRQQNRVRIFETGQVFQGELPELSQRAKIGGLLCGERDAEGWSGRREKVDFFDLKGDVEGLLALGGELDAWRFEPAEHPALHPGQSAQILYGSTPVGCIGALHPAVRAKLGIKPDVFVFEIDLETARQGRLPAFSSLSRYPEVRRDLALAVRQDLSVQTLMDTIRAQAGEWLTDLRLFDVYQGKGVEEGHKSFALGLTWQHPSRTLNDEEINQLIDNIVDGVKTRYNATLRG